MTFIGRMRLAVRDQIAKAQKTWWESRERILARTHKALTAERAMHLSQRQWNQELQRELDAKEKAIEKLKARADDPLAVAARLCELAEEILAPVYIGSGAINSYEIKCWMADYRSFKQLRSARVNNKDLS